jgi:hypothetical protein
MAPEHEGRGGNRGPGHSTQPRRKTPAPPRSRARSLSLALGRCPNTAPTAARSCAARRTTAANAGARRRTRTRCGPTSITPCTTASARRRVPPPPRTPMRCVSLSLSLSLSLALALSRSLPLALSLFFSLSYRGPADNFSRHHVAAVVPVARPVLRACLPETEGEGLGGVRGGDDLPWGAADDVLEDYGPRDRLGARVLPEPRRHDGHASRPGACVGCLPGAI